MGTDDEKWSERGESEQHDWAGWPRPGSSAPSEKEEYMKSHKSNKETDQTRQDHGALTLSKPRKKF